MINKKRTANFLLLVLTVSLMLPCFCGCSTQMNSTAENTIEENEVNHMRKYNHVTVPNSVERVIEYTYSSEGNIISITQHASENDEDKTHKYEFDEDNNLIAHCYCDCLLEEYIYDNGKCVTEKYYDSDGTVIELHEYTYAHEVLVSEYCEFSVFPEVENDEGEIVEVEFTEYYYREYNTSGKLVKETCYEYDSEPYTNEYMYSDNKAVMKSISASGEHFFTETTTYDDEGRTISVHWLFVDDNSTSETVYSYEDNQVTETYFSDGEKLHYFVSGYNSEGHIVHYIAYSAENEVLRVITFEYDEHNNISKIQRTQNEEITVWYAPEREYNSNGDIVSETYYSDVNYFSDAMLELYQINY